MSPHPLLIAIGGPTASGKSAAALELARLLQKSGRAAEILCADSITHYRGFDIGSTKPSPAEREEIPHHLLDIADPSEEFTAGDFVRAADAQIEKLFAAKKIPIVVGGSGFYLKALLQGMASDTEENRGEKMQIRAALDSRLDNEGAEILYAEMVHLDPALQAQIHINDTYRIIRALEAMQLSGKRWSELNQEAERRPPKYAGARIFCLDIPREQLRERIAIRSQALLDQGLIAEVEQLLAQGISPEAKPFLSIGYRQVLEFLGKISPPTHQARPTNHAELAAAISKETMRLAKSQSTWFRGQAENAEWIPYAPNPAQEIFAKLAQENQLC